ncbi:unnamed protein product [Psylliodes chrysocephalus]|uniref:F-box domain-containing protein n=1 Tax=Psylliodes chrysocephalus TaxID=3402493 RepID=A0A9P0CW08_9CUCU|nr:unnamed protein product [Psylliodes chrysocephala]
MSHAHTDSGTAYFKAAILPVETWVKILRYLDGISLLSATKALSEWIEICEGDVVLRKKLTFAKIHLESGLKKMEQDQRILSILSEDYRIKNLRRALISNGISDEYNYRPPPKIKKI